MGKAASATAVTSATIPAGPVVGSGGTFFFPAPLPVRPAAPLGAAWPGRSLRAGAPRATPTPWRLGAPSGPALRPARRRGAAGLPVGLPSGPQPPAASLHATDGSVARRRLTPGRPPGRAGLPARFAESPGRAA